MIKKEIFDWLYEKIWKDPVFSKLISVAIGFLTAMLINWYAPQSVKDILHLSPTSQEAQAPYPRPSASKITREKYNQIQLGMTYEQVVEIMGDPGEEGGSADVVKVYYWTNADNSSVSVGFANGKVTSKSNINL